jgi:7-cyano-7-deazaguanine synthase in queuosine biosynthesis
MNGTTQHIVLCNGADILHEFGQDSAAKSLRLEYRLTEPDRNVKLLLPNFVRNVFHLPDRILDLLEIAGYVYAADRLVLRGMKDALEYHNWSRSFNFVIKVRDISFWKQPTVRKKISEALCFMSGDREYNFDFHPGHSTPPTGLFDRKEFKIEPGHETNIVLFSGGIDSLAGAIERLQHSKSDTCLVSHRSGQPETTRTQKQLFQTLHQRYPKRISYYSFYCSLTGIRATEETQRTRAFLYTTIAYAISSALAQNKFFVYENGITSLNFPRRQDLMNARASRTSHPKTISLLESFFSEVEGSPVKIEAPFLWKTKADIFQTIADSGHKDLISSTVSCSRTFENLEHTTHCGGCFQCIDRRFAAYGSKLDEYDETGIYTQDFIRNVIVNPEVKTALLDYIRQALDFSKSSLDQFYYQRLNELVDIIEYIPGVNEEEAVEKIWNLCHRHGQQVEAAIRRMREVFDKPFEEIPENSLLKIVADREYLKEPIRRLVDDICQRLKKAIPIAFPAKNLPKSEKDLNDKVAALLDSYKSEFDREHPAVLFAGARTIPDHAHSKYDLLVETKFARGSTTASRVSDGIAADLIKYPQRKHTLFIVFDPERSIINDARFAKDFEVKGRCTVCIIR